MSALKISVALNSPMLVPRHPIHLDGVLSRLRVDQAVEDGLEDPWAVQHELPLEKYHSPSGQWVFKASWFRPKSRLSAPFLSLMTSRMNFMSVAKDIESGLLDSRLAAPNPAGGPFKTPILSIQSQWVDEIVAFAMGDRAGVTALLTNLKFLGGRRSQALGRVESVLVDEIDESECAWYVRALPIDADCPEPGQTMALTMGNLRAPYWKQANRQRIVQPVND